MINKTYMYLYVHGFVLLSCRYEVNKYVLCVNMTLAASDQI